MISLLLTALVAASPVAPRSSERERVTAQPSAAAPDRATLAAIYERPGFEAARQRKGDALKALLTQAKHWLLSLFETSGAATYSNLTRVLVLGIAALAGLSVASWLLARRRARRSPIAAPSAAGRLELEDPSIHLARARQLATIEPRQAIREGLLALLSQLERQRLARPDRVKTNRELAQELPARGALPELAEAVSAALGWYDLAFYSLEPVTPDAARGFLDQVARLGLAPPEPRR